ncbi:MAG: peptidoglycan D,D-transpeptidase FtsI family protein, partial [Actinomycetes bacterium]
ADPLATAHALAPVLDMNEAALREKLASDTSFVYLARKVDDGVAEAVKRLHLAGIQLLDEPKRIVPSGDLAGPVLGQVGVDDEGLSGLEKQYEKVLTGRAGELLVERDPGGNDIAAGLRQLKPSARGDNLVLTLDRAMQYETERALRDSIVSANAKGGMALVMDPTTGEILAMANLVVEKKGQPPVAPADNMAVTRVFEPGSTNKVVTVAAALEEGVVNPSTRMNVADTLQVADVLFHDAEEHELMWWTTADILAHSSNVGTIQVAQRLGPQRLARAALDFGYGKVTGVDFPGESAGLVNPVSQWRCTDLGVNAIGQGVAVTVLQMASVYATVANNGVLRPPTLLRGMVDAHGRVEKAERKPGRRVVSARTARTLSRILEGVVEDGGTGTEAALDEWRVAGKTGTARKPDTEHGGYLPGAYVGSFIGFAPAQRPAVVVAVVIDQPTRGYYGGSVAAPVFREVTASALRRQGVVPTLPAKAVR